MPPFGIVVKYRQMRQAGPADGVNASSQSLCVPLGCSRLVLLLLSLKLFFVHILSQINRKRGGTAGVTCFRCHVMKSNLFTDC
jgi:hypothetical protein